jgi:hypothetical protein
MMKKHSENKREKLKLLPSDFYVENGMKVMKEEYHIRRGYCCGSGCRYCPYFPKGQKGNTLVKK